MILKSLTFITKEDLQRLVDNQVPDGWPPEYKREVPENSAYSSWSPTAWCANSTQETYAYQN